MSSPSEQAFELTICKSLASAGGYSAVKVGNAADRDADDFSAELALDTAELFAFIGATQADEWEKVRKSHSSPDEAQRAFAQRLAKEIESRGAVDVLRHGVVYAGHEKAEFRLGYFRPASGLNADLEAKYQANRLTVTRQLPYDPGSTKTLDLGLFLNGIPVATAEIKNHLTGQTVEDAIRQYRKDRDPRNALLRRAIVHFAVDTEQVYMTTKLDGDGTRFLPFNRGDGDRKGNPANPDGYLTSYLWDDVWSRDAWLDLLARFVFVRGTGADRTVFFPRYHQRDAVLRLTSHAREHGAGHSYLVQHSAGSGKSNTIAWLAHRLSSLHDADDTKVFDKVVVITDRLVLDRQLQETIYQFEHTHGVVQKIDENSKQLAEALTGESSRIVITTIQKFPHVMRHVEELQARRYAVIIDEAHSSQTGDSAKEMKKVLGGGDTDPATTDADALARAEAAEAGLVDEVPDPVQDRLLEEVRARGRQANMSFFAFTATPKGRTLELFGRRNDDTGKYEPFHLYSMRQAIEEGFIHDVLANYVTYETYFKIDKAITDDPELDKARASAAIARFVSLHEHNLSQRADVVINHFRTHVASKVGGEAKAMVVTASRLHALRYKRALDRYCTEHGIGDVGVLCAFSGKLDDDGEEWTESKVNGFPESETPKRFDTDDWQLLVVAEKYQTGFDQPKLYAMYVDKTLTGLAAVQTLSRLNRTHPAKTGTFVLDFRNDHEQIQQAFAPWYVRTHAPPTDPHLLYDTHAELGPFDVLRTDEVETMVGLLLDDPEKNHQRIVSMMGPAVDRFGALSEERQDEFRDLLTRFTRIYSFLSQVVSFTDVKLERDYLFCRRLAQMVKRDSAGGVDLGDKVELTHLKMEQAWSGDASLDDADGEVVTIYGGSGRSKQVDEVPLSEEIRKINERFAVNLSEENAVFYGSVDTAVAGDAQVQAEAAANPFERFRVGLEQKWDAKLIEQLKVNEDLVYAALDNPELKEAWLDRSAPGIYAQARVARQRTCPVGDLIRSDGETRFLEYKSTLRWDVQLCQKSGVMEDAVVKTIAGFANSRYGGTLLVGVADDGKIHGLEDDYATFSKRGERGDRDLWGQHLKNLLDRLGKSAASLVDWEFFTIDDADVCRISIEPSDHPVYETKGKEQLFWWRTPVSTDAISDAVERDNIIARRWAA
ncbi:DEAD/DEAH box helicase family protein [Ilumatobacter sp.]|uniref:DEAD/DEAH box helicase family protein n=1 Tax=Ilumatobacter sp. TaxID=1967498 RepID=UPI003B52AF62